MRVLALGVLPWQGLQFVLLPAALLTPAPPFWVDVSKIKAAAPTANKMKEKECHLKMFMPFDLKKEQVTIKLEKKLKKAQIGMNRRNLICITHQWQSWVGFAVHRGELPDN